MKYDYNIDFLFKSIFHILFRCLIQFNIGMILTWS